jgi:phosphoribosylcarboxyaminoimidazole (NCAIR) mutase
MRISASLALDRVRGWPLDRDELGVVAALATVITLPYGVLVGCCSILTARPEGELTLGTLRADLQAAAA